MSLVGVNVDNTTKTFDNAVVFFKPFELTPEEVEGGPIKNRVNRLLPPVELALQHYKEELLAQADFFIKDNFDQLLQKEVIPGINKCAAIRHLRLLDELISNSKEKKLIIMYLIKHWWK